MSLTNPDQKVSEYLQPSEFFAAFSQKEGEDTSEMAKDTDDEALRLISCLNTGKCRVIQLEDNEFAVDMADKDTILDLKGAKINENGDFVFQNHPIITPGRRNGDWYSADAIRGAVHYSKDRKTRKHLPLESQAARFVIKHTDHPLQVVGAVQDLHYSESPEPGMYGDYVIYNDPNIPASQTAVALLSRWSKEGSIHIPTSARFVVRRHHTKEHGSTVDDLRLVHVAWVEMPADENAGVHVNNQKIEGPWSVMAKSDGNGLMMYSSDNGLSWSTSISNIYPMTTSGSWTITSSSTNEAEKSDTEQSELESKGETPMADKQKEQDAPKMEADPVAPPVDNEVAPPKEDVTVDQETLTISVADLEQVVEQRVSERVPKIVADLKAEFEAQKEREMIMVELSQKDDEIDKDFLASLDNKQLAALNALLGGYVKQYDEINEKVAQLEQAGTGYNDYKPTFSGARPHKSNDEIDDIVKKYYPVPEKMTAGAKMLAGYLSKGQGDQ